MRSPHRRPILAVAAVTALLTFTACTDNPVAPASASLHATSSPSFSRSASGPYTFTRFDVVIAGTTYPTIPSGINASGVVVGYYWLGTGCPSNPTTCVMNGFILKDGVLTTPVIYHNAAGTNALWTQLRGIGPSGEIVGSYRMPGEPLLNLHGFRYTTTGEFINVDYPGQTNTVAQRILPNGTIVGCYHGVDQSSTMRSVVFDKNGASVLDVPTTMHMGSTPSGNRLTGRSMGQGKARAYVLEGEEFTQFDAPGSTSTDAWDMNPSGTIVGFFVGGGTTHGFVLEHWSVVGGAVEGIFTTINFPVSASTNAFFTDIFGINASGDFVGKFKATATDSFHGYIATRKGAE